MTAAAKHKKDGEASEGPTHHDKSAGAGGSEARQTCTSPYRTPVLPHALSYYVRLSHARALARRSHESSGESRLGPSGKGRRGRSFVPCSHADGELRRRRRRRLERLAGGQQLLQPWHLGLIEASPALAAACSLEDAMLEAAGAGGEAALVTLLLTSSSGSCACRTPSPSRRRARAGITSCSPRAHTCTCRTGRCRTLAEEVVLQGIGADAGGDAARPAAAQAAPALAPHPVIGEAAWGLGEARRQKKTRLNRQVEVCCVSCLALVLWKNHSAE